MINKLRPAKTCCQQLTFQLKTYSFKAIKTLKGICGVRLDDRKVLRAPGTKTKYFECFFIVQ